MRFSRMNHNQLQQLQQESHPFEKIFGEKNPIPLLHQKVMPKTQNVRYAQYNNLSILS